jgi:hypothetical protein
LVASCLLIVIILLQDGVGGTGSRVGLLLMRPGQNAILALQEQISRTGVMLGTNYAFPESAYQAPINLHGQKERERTLEWTPEGASGEWFANRSIQGHFLAELRPSRASVERQSGGGDVRPTLVSRINEPLREVYYFDESNRVWMTNQLLTGRPAELKKTTIKVFNKSWWHRHVKDSGVEAGGNIDAIKAVPGYVYGVIDAKPGVWLPAHPAVEWKQEHMIVAGPVVTGREGS